MTKKLCLILGDQLNPNHARFQQVDDDTLFLMAEVRQETDYVRHHIRKVVAFFQAMREFAQSLQEKGHQIIYVRLDDENNPQNFSDLILQIIDSHAIEKFEYFLPDEYRLDEQLKSFAENLSIPCEVFDTEHFLTERHEVGDFFREKKTFLMESFYRKMRKKYDILIEKDGKPTGGKWNYDSENRKKLPKNHTLTPPKLFPKKVSELVEMVQKSGVETIGTIKNDTLYLPMNRTESLTLLDYFLENLLPQFGTYQDAMTVKDWVIYHARISFSLNIKLISPLEVVQKTLVFYKNNPEIQLSQIEGFIRQIIGWREYVRGLYWEKMPTYETLNFFENTRPLPDYFWTAKTKMACIRHAVGQSLDYAYAHHIQRLMITGNFMLLAGTHPDEADAWYLGIYADALQWVELPNTRGMSQFADGGILGTKPYASSANYIHKMSDYCTHCRYDRKLKVGEHACPFNSLYWHFFERNRDKLAKNARLAMVWRNLDKMEVSQKQKVLEQAEFYLENIEDL